MIRPAVRRPPVLTGSAVALLVLGLAACQQKTEAPAPVAAAPPAATTPVAATPAATSDDSEHHGDAAQTLEEARAQGHREGMEMERDAHERGMEMGAKAHAEGMSSKNGEAAPMKKADPPMKMDSHM